jgi:hypothetical protein
MAPDTGKGLSPKKNTDSGCTPIRLLSAGIPPVFQCLAVESPAKGVSKPDFRRLTYSRLFGRKTLGKCNLISFQSPLFSRNVKNYPFSFAFQSVVSTRSQHTGRCLPVIIRKETFPKVMICNSHVLRATSILEVAFWQVFLNKTKRPNQG